MTFFKKLDFFGSPIGLIYKSDSAYRTIFGAILTIMFISLISSLFYSSILSLFQKANVTSTSSQIYSIDPDSITIDTNTYMLAVKIDQTNFVNRPLFNITLDQRIYTRYENGTFIKNTTANDLEPCTFDHFKDLPSQGKNKIYTLQGRYENSRFDFLKFSVTACKNSTYPRTWGPVCASTDDIAAVSADQGTRVNFLFSNTIISPEQPSDIVQTFLENMIYNFQPSTMYSTANIFLNKQTVVTDNSLILFEDLQTDEYAVYTQNDFKASYSVGSYSKYGEFYFLRSNQSRYIERRFQKIDEVLSYIGGFVQIFLIFFTAIVSIYNSFTYQLELANKLYEFDFSEDLDGKKIIKKKKKQSYLQHSSTYAGGNSGGQLLAKDYSSGPIVNTYEKSNGFTYKTNNEYDDKKSKFNMPTQNTPNAASKLAFSQVISNNTPSITKGFLRNDSLPTQAPSENIGGGLSTNGSDVQLLRPFGSAKTKKSPVSAFLSQQFLEKKLHDMRVMTRKITGTVGYFINVLTFGRFCNTPSVRLLHEVNSQIDKDLDVYVLIQRLKELEKLKQLMLTEEQQVLFNFFPRQVISLAPAPTMPTPENLEDEENDNILRQKQKKNFLNPANRASFKSIAFIIKAFTKFKRLLKRNRISVYKRLYESYENIMDSKQTNPTEVELNRKLVEMLGPKLKPIFEQARLIEYKEKVLSKPIPPYRSNVVPIENGSSQVINIDTLQSQNNVIGAVPQVVSMRETHSQPLIPSQTSQVQEHYNFAHDQPMFSTKTKRPSAFDKQLLAKKQAIYPEKTKIKVGSGTELINPSYEAIKEMNINRNIELETIHE